MNVRNSQSPGVSVSAAANPVPGTLGVNTLTTTFTTTGTHTTLQDEGLTVTANDVVGRRYRFSLMVAPYTPGGLNSVIYTLLRDGVKVRDFVLPSTATSTTDSHAICYIHVETIAVTHQGSVYKVQIAASPTNTSVASFGSVALPRQLIVEDVGT